MHKVTITFPVPRKLTPDEETELKLGILHFITTRMDVAAITPSKKRRKPRLKENCELSFQEIQQSAFFTKRPASQDPFEQNNLGFISKKL